MTDRRREAVLGASIALVVVLGFLYEALGPRVKPAMDPAPAGLFHQQAMFCPGVPRGADASGSLAVYAGAGREVPVSLEGVDEEEAVVPASGFLGRDMQGPRPVDVIGEGAAVHSSVTMRFREPLPGAAATSCSDEAATEWFFPEGSSDFRYDQRLLVYNPFPDEAVVKVTFLTRAGETAKAGLANVAVPSGEAVQVRVNRFIPQRPALASRVTSVRGRIVVWRVLYGSPEGRPHGVDLSLGATEGSSTWFFPAGTIDGSSDERVTVLNPSDDREAIVTVNLTTDEERVQPKDLVEVRIGPNSARTFSLSDVTTEDGKDPGPASTVVQSVNGAPVVAEHSLAYGSDGFKGTASEMGSPAGAQTLWLGPGATEPRSDRVVLMNLGARKATVALTLLSESAPVELPPLVMAPGRAEISLDDYEVEGPSAVLVEVDRPLVAERVTQSAAGDVAVIAGVPAKPSGP